ncbi:unnamed protein product [Sphagnum troendelagicum]|uniref:Uncharacterized protein n=1 Tax=Sphagnum troendelagicum TaxID=128251 RepID=A0ABP0TSA8_9BRYO
MSPKLEGLTIIQQDDHQVFRGGAPGRRNLAVEDSKLPIELNLPVLHRADQLGWSWICCYCNRVVDWEGPILLCSVQALHHQIPCFHCRPLLSEDSQEVPKGQEEVGGKKEGGGELCARARRAHPRDGRLLFKNWFHN